MGKTSTKKQKKDCKENLFCKQIDVAEHRNLADDGQEWLSFARDMIEIRKAKTYTAATSSYPNNKFKTFDEFLDNFGFAMAGHPMSETSLERIKKIIKLVDAAEKACLDLDKAMLYYANAKTWDTFFTIKDAYQLDVVAKLTLLDWEHGDQCQDKLTGAITDMLKEHPEWKVGYRRLPNPCDTIFGLAKNITQDNLDDFIERIEKLRESGEQIDISLTKVDHLTELAARLNGAYDGTAIVVADQKYLTEELGGFYNEDSNIIELGDKQDPDAEAEERAEEKEKLRVKIVYGIMLGLMIFGVFGVGDLIWRIVHWCCK